MNAALSPLAAEAVQHLRALLRIDTSNPPGNERLAADYIAGVLRAAGVEATVIETAPGRGNVIARLRGTGAAGALLLYSHLDVVPVEHDRWTVDPFAAVVRDGHVYGRGAVDMKGIGAMQLAVFLALARQQQAGRARFARDLILAATADEETDDNQGMGPLCAAHPELLRAEYAWSEFGGYPLPVGGKTFYPIQTGEKGTAWLTLRVSGTPGHASIPRDDNAVVKLARVLDRLDRLRLPLRLTPTARAMLKGLADGLGGAPALALRAVLSGEQAFPSLSDWMLDATELTAELRAITHNTVTPTGLRAGYKTNVVPSEASATLDCRVLPGSSAEELIADLQRGLGEAARGITFTLDSSSPPVEFPADTPMMDVIRRAIQKHDPNGIVIPTMLTGATDAKHVATLGAVCYGFSPLRFAPGESLLSLAHGHDERVSIEGLAWGAQVMYDAVVLALSQA